MSSSRPRPTFAEVPPGAAAGALLWCALVVCACGAEGRPAPYVPAPHAASTCPSSDDALQHTTSALDGRARADGREVVGRVLGELGGIKVLLQALFSLAADADDDTFDALHALPPADGLGALGAYVAEVLRYIDGTERYVEPHPEPVAAAHAIVSSCEAATTWRALSGLLALDVKEQPDGALVLAAYGAGERAWLGALLDIGQRALDEPEVQDALARIELEDDDAPPGTDTIRVGREAFQLLFHIVASNLGAPDFDPVYTRQIIDDALLVLIDGPAARAAADRMLDVLFLPMDPDADVFLDTQALVACVDDADEDRALAGMIFDWTTVDELSPGAFLDDVASQSSSDAAGALRPVAIRLFGSLASRPSLAADTARVAAHFLAEKDAPAVVRLLIDLKGQGIVAEVLAFFHGLTSCR